MDSKEVLRNNPWAQFCGVKSLESLENIEMKIPVTETENKKLNPKDMYLYKSCLEWEELIFVRCRFCRGVILPQGIKGHVEKRHSRHEPYDRSQLYSLPKGKLISPTGSLSSPGASSVYSRSSLPSSSSYRVSSSASATCTSAKVTNWPFNKKGAYPQSPLNMTMSANIVRVKPEKLKAAVPAYTKASSSGKGVTLGKNITQRKNAVNKKELSHLRQSPVLRSFTFPSTSSSVMPSTSSNLLPCQSFLSAETKFELDSVYNSVLQSSLPSSTSLEKPADNSEGAQGGKKTPTLEKLVLRRVLQTDPKAPAVRRQSVQGMKGISKNKKNAQETYFMVVKDKDRQHNLMAARQHIRKQSNVVHQEKDKVEQKMKKLETVRDKLISQLFQELQNVKQKLNQCNLSKQELQRELIAVREQLEETKRNTDCQTEALSKQNMEYKNEIQELKQRLDDLTASTSTFLEQTQMYGGLGNNSWNFSEDQMSQQLQASEEQKLQFHIRMEELECELRELKNSTTIEKGRMELRLRQYFRVINELKKRLDAQLSQTEELEAQRDFYEQHLPPELCFEVKSQLAAYPRQTEVYEIYPGMMATQPTVPPPAGPLAETLLTDIQNFNYRAYQPQVAPELVELFQQQEKGFDEEVS